MINDKIIINNNIIFNTQNTVYKTFNTQYTANSDICVFFYFYELVKEMKYDTRS